MRNKAFVYVLLIAVLLLCGAALSASARETEPHYVEATSPQAARPGIAMEPKGVSGEEVYIVRLEDDPLASYRGQLRGLNATSPKVTGADKLDIQSAESVSYRNYLASRQNSFLAVTESNLGRELDVIYKYDVAYNGVAMTLTPAEATAVAKQPGVVQVQRSQWRQAHTDVSPAFLGVDKVWDGSGVSGLGTKGEGVIVAIIDTGIWPEHPSFADDGSYAIPADWGGGCQEPEDNSQPLTCNNKLIGASHFLDTYVFYGGGYDGLFFSARDDNGHGTHTASTAAGNEGVEATLLGVDRGKISGIAPRAHIAAYKGLGPQGGYTPDLVASINAAIADGVDVINYSIGGSTSDPWVDADSQAFLAARDAGIFVATSAGNSGPDAETVGSPGNAPWITTVGASTSNRQFISDITLKGPGEPPVGLYGVSLTAGVTDFNLVDAEGIADQGGDVTGRCINPYPAGTFKATDVVLCKRGLVARVVRGNNVEAGGGGGVILYNAAADQGLSTDNYVIPGVHTSLAAGQAIKGYIAAHPGQVKVSFTAGQKALEGVDARVQSDVMADFSSRGPNGTAIDVIKPDVSAPGMQILAGHTPECYDHDDACGAQGELFQSIQGTSMSSPQVAGAAALVAAIHPDWSPAEIESALMTTANTNLFKENGTSPADPFDMGGGRINVAMAVNAPLILNESKANYLAADPFVGGDPKSLNNASLGNSSCVVECSWTRTVENSSGMQLTWDTSIVGLPGAVEPENFTLTPGSTQVVTATVNVSGLEFDTWAFATLSMIPRTGDGVSQDMPSSHLPIAVMPDITTMQDQIVIDTRRDAGSYLMEDIMTVAITDMTLIPYGLEPADDFTITLMQDETRGDPYDDLDQVWYATTVVPEGAVRYVNAILESTAPDVDLFVGFDDNGNGMPDNDEQVCESTTSSWNEYCNIDKPDAGTWWVLVQNWKSFDADAFDDIELATAVVPGSSAGNVTFDAPESAPENNPFDLRVKFDLENTYPGQAWFGAFSIGSDAGHPGDVGKVNIDLHRLENDVVKSVNKSFATIEDTLEFTIKVNPNLLAEDVDYRIVDTIPEGMTYVAGSAEASSGKVVVDGRKLVWKGTLPNPESLPRTYIRSTSAEDPSCNTYQGGYINLEDKGFYAQPDVSGNNESFLYFVEGNPINFYGINYRGMVITDNGFVLFDIANNHGGLLGVPQEIPDAAQPNNLAAMLWQDMEIVYDGASNKGVSAIVDGDNIMIVEFDDIQLLGDSSNTYDFEIVMTRAVDDNPGAYEIVFAYDNLKGSLVGPLTIGVENASADEATAYINNATAAGKLTDGMMVCFDWNAPLHDATISYETTIDADVGNDQLLRNRVRSTTSHVGSKPVTTEATVRVGHTVYFPLFHSDFSGYIPGDREQEPNDQYMFANGALRSDRAYHGGFSKAADIDDYYYFITSRAGNVDVSLKNIPQGQDYDLILRNQELDVITFPRLDGNQDEVISSNLPKGVYYIQINNYGLGVHPDDYSLKVIYE